MMDANSHWFQFLDFYTLCVYNVNSNCLPARMHNYICCIYLTFLQCVLQMYPQITYQRGGTTAVFAFIWFFSTVYFQMCPRLKASACMEAKSSWLHTFTFLHSAFSNVSPNVLPEKMQSHIGCILLGFSPLCVFKCALKLSAREEA